ncbi:MAG: tetratricopeptide repeat-containing protein [Pseudomonadota bacterium]
MNELGVGLPAIIAYARAGSLEQAWAMFQAAGYDRAGDDPAALAIKGRLLKDRAQRLAGLERAALYAEAARAYAASAGISGATYPLINAATLSLLAGDVARSADLARQVLARIEDHPDEPETPYYRAATGAEALLLLGRGTDAEIALSEAVSLAPRAWEDHASTLRQIALILAAQKREAGWLDQLRPPRSLHFGGHMSFRADTRPEPLTRNIAALLAEERIGFGFGALAAGADILVAEALLEAGAELQLLLPGGIEAFAALSVDPFGAGWRRRFDLVLGRAAGVRAVAPFGRRPDQAMIDLADEIAMGTALGNARRLASEAVQLLVLDNAAGEMGSRSAAIWTGGGKERRQYILIAAREDVGALSVAAPAGAEPSLATLAIPVSAAGGSDEAERLREIKAVLDQGAAPAIPASFTGEMVLVSYDGPDTAAEAATALSEGLGDIAVGGHYGVCALTFDPFNGGAKATGRTLTLARAAAGSALPGAVCVSEDFAMALEVIDPARFQASFIGELVDPEDTAPIGLYGLRRGL